MLEWAITSNIDVVSLLLPDRRNQDVLLRLYDYFSSLDISESKKLWTMIIERGNSYTRSLALIMSEVIQDNEITRQLVLDGARLSLEDYSYIKSEFKISRLIQFLLCIVTASNSCTPVIGLHPEILLCDAIFMQSPALVNAILTTETTLDISHWSSDVFNPPIWIGLIDCYHIYIYIYNFTQCLYIQFVWGFWTPPSRVTIQL